MAVQTDLFTAIAIQMQLSAAYLWKSNTRTILYFMSFSYLINAAMAVSVYLTNSHRVMLTNNDTASEEGIDPWGR